MQVVDKYGNTFGQGHLVITTKSGKSKLPVVTVAWGNITGVLANQTDLQDALDLKVPKSRTLTINGVTQDLSADRSWTISTGITVNTTPITGGTSGRLLFDNAGTVGETSGVSWDSTTATLSLFDSPFVSQAGNLSANTSFSITGTASSNYTISSSRQFIFNTGQSMYFNTDTDGGSALDRAWYFAGARTGMTGGRTYGALTVDSSGFPSFTLYNNDNGPRILLASNATSYFNGGNLLVGTNTDAGYKLDVNGTTRLQRTLDLGSVGYAGTINLRRAGDGGITSQITQTDNVTVIHNYQGSGTEFKVDNVTYFHVRGFANQYAARVMGNLTAVSGLSTALLVNNTISASANNDVLIGLDVAPTFNNGAFTGVQNYAARFGGNIVFQPGATRTISVLNPTSSGSGNHLVIQSGSATTSGNGGDIYLNVGGGAGGPGPGRIYIGNNNGWDVAYVRGLLTVNNSGPNTGVGFQVNSGGQTGLSIYWDNLTPFMQYGLVSGRQSRFVNSSSYSFSTNLIIGATVNAGYMLDVNGTARIQNAFTIASSVFNVLSTSSSLFFVDTGSNNYRIANFIGYGGYHPGSGTNNTGDIFSVGANPSSSANGTSFFRLNYNGGNSSGIYGSSGNNVSLAQLNATTLSRLYLTAQGSGLLLQGGTSGNSIISTVADGDNLNLRSEKGTGGGGGGINYLSSINGSNHSHRFFHNNVEQMRLQYSGNLLIGTTTDAGFRLDVNGTARVNGDLTLTNNSSLSWGNGNFVQVNNSNPDWKFYVQSSLILTLGQSQITLGISANTRAFFPSSDNTHDIGQQFARYRHGWLSGQLKVGDATAVNTSAKVQIDSTTQGFLPPRMTNTEMLAIGTPAEGLVVYDLTNRKLCCYDGATWQPLF